MKKFSGMYLFFLIERFLKIFMDMKARKSGQVLGERIDEIIYYY